jgi:hypothetical protein
MEILKCTFEELLVAFLYHLLMSLLSAETDFVSVLHWYSFSLFCFVSFARDLSILMTFFKELALCFIDFLMLFYFQFNSYLFLLLLLLSFACLGIILLFS